METIDSLPHLRVDVLVHHYAERAAHSVQASVERVTALPVQAAPEGAELRPGKTKKLRKKGENLSLSDPQPQQLQNNHKCSSKRPNIGPLFHTLIIQLFSQQGLAVC